MARTKNVARTDSFVRPRRGEGRVIAGVCAALADRFGISRTLVRLLFVIFGVVGAGEIAYIVLWIIIPKADSPRARRAVRRRR
jgi:phage shock protein C